MSVLRTLAPCCVHLRIIPRPKNLSESREILRVLQRFGEISMFKYLRYEYHNPAQNTALAIYHDQEAAQKALDSSPVRFALERMVCESDEPFTSSVVQENEEEEEGEVGEVGKQGPDSRHDASSSSTRQGIDEILRPSQLLTRQHPPPPSSPVSRASPPLSAASTAMPFDPPPPPPGCRKQSKWFQVTLDRSHAIHQDFIERQPFWKQFSPMKSMAQQDLAKQVPHIGLSDVSKRPPNAHRTPNKVLRVMSGYVDRHMPTLRGLVDGEGGDGHGDDVGNDSAQGKI